MLTQHRNVQRFRGGLVFKAHRLVYHSTLGLRVIKKKKKGTWMRQALRTARTKSERELEAHRLLYHSTLGSRVTKKKVGGVATSVAILEFSPIWLRNWFLMKVCYRGTSLIRNTQPPRITIGP